MAVTGWADPERVEQVKRKAENRRAYHETRVNDAPNARQRFSAACGWLLSEAALAGELDAATEMVLTRIHEIRNRALDPEFGWSTS